MTMLSSVGIQNNDRFLRGPSLFLGATTAPSLIFILPGLFYIRIIPTDQEPMRSRPKIQVGSNLFLTQRGQRLKKVLQAKSLCACPLVFQAACFAALGFIFMTMSLTFIGLDWMSGEKQRLGAH